MPKLTQKQKNELWSSERKALMQRVERLRAAGVILKIDIQRPEKISVAHIAALKSATKSRLLTGINNKVIKVETKIPENVHRNAQGQITATKDLLQKWRATERQIREEAKLIKERANIPNPYDDIDWNTKLDTDIDIKKEKQKLNERSSLVIEPEIIEDYEPAEPIEHLFHPIYINDAVLDAKWIDKKYSDDYSEYSKMIANSKNMREEMSPEMRQHIAKMRDEKGEISDRLEKELEDYYLSHPTAELEGTSYTQGTLYIDYEKGKRYTVDSDGVVSEEPLQGLPENFKYYRDKNTGSIYSQEDSRIYWRDNRGRFKRDNNGEMMIKPNLVEVTPEPMSKEEYDALIMDLLTSRYENVASDVSTIVVDKYREWNKKYSPEEIRYAEESAAADGYDITYADMYENNEERLALKLRVIESYLPDKNYFDRQKAIEDLAQYDEEQEDYEEPD